MFPDIGTNENMVTRYLYINVICIVPEIVDGITEHVKWIQVIILFIVALLSRFLMFGMIIYLALLKK